MFGIVFAFILFTMPVTALAIDPPAYSDRDSTYTAPAKQINTLYRNAINGEGDSYTASDQYTDYYGNIQTTTTTVTTKILINDSNYYSSDLHKRIDTRVDTDKYSLKNDLHAGRADRADVSNFSSTAYLARKTDYGGYLPRDCSSDPSCSVKWVNTIDFSLYTRSAEQADTETCPTGSINPYVHDVSGTSGFAALLMAYQIISQNALCQHDISKIYHARSTDTTVREGMYLIPGGKYHGAERVIKTTKAQRTGFANYAQWFTTYNEFTGQDIEGHIAIADFSKNAITIKNENMSYTGGNTERVIITVP